MQSNVICVYLRGYALLFLSGKCLTFAPPCSFLKALTSSWKGPIFDSNTDLRSSLPWRTLRPEQAGLKCWKQNRDYDLEGCSILSQNSSMEKWFHQFRSWKYSKFLAFHAYTQCADMLHNPLKCILKRIKYPQKRIHKSVTSWAVIKIASSVKACNKKCGLHFDEREILDSGFVALKCFSSAISRLQHHHRETESR